MIPRSDEEQDRIDNKLCANCCSPLEGRRKAYCSDRCTREYWIKHDWGSLRNSVLQKSNYTCAKCGYRIARDSLYWSLFVVDHIKPIFLGGNEFDENNLQVLCKPCDKKKTAKDKQRYYDILRGMKAVQGFELLFDGALHDEEDIFQRKLEEFQEA